MIFGCPGSGKSTFAKRLSQKLHIPLYHNDKYYYTNNWQERPTKDFERDICAIAAQDTYIIDGNCSRLLLKYDMSVDLIIYFDMPLWKCYWRVIKRRFSKDTTIDDRAPECKERLAWSFLYSMWGYKQKTDPRLEQCKLKYPTTRFVYVHNDDEVEIFLKDSSV